VFWWFERSGKFSRCKAREVSESGAYELVVMMPDGTEGIEWFSDEAALRDRQTALDRALQHEGWTGPHGGPL
jgi:hypothetical protein